MKIAALLLSPEEIKDYLVPGSARWAGADEFQTARTFQRFVAEWRDRVRDETARFPIRVVDTQALVLSAWNSQQQNFTLGRRLSPPRGERFITLPLSPPPHTVLMPPMPFRLVLDRDMPMSLPADEAHAEAIVAELPMRGREKDRQVYLRRELEITAPPRWIPAQNRFDVATRVTRMELFADAAFTKLLLSDADIRKTDVSSAIAIVAVRPPSQIWLGDDETLFLLRARAGLLSDGDWISEMERRRSRDRAAPAANQPPQPLAWGRFFPPDYPYDSTNQLFPPEHVAAFQDWTKRRAELIRAVWTSFSIALPPAAGLDPVELPLWRANSGTLSPQELGMSTVRGLTFRLGTQSRPT